MDWDRRQRTAGAILFVVFYGAILALRDAGHLPIVAGAADLIARIGR